MMMRAGPDVTRLRVAHLIESDGPGGAERVVAELARALQNSGVYTVVFLPADGEGWLTKQLEGSNVAIEQFRLVRPVSLACARWLEAGLRRHGVTVAHSHDFTMAVYGTWAARRAGIPHVITMHGGRYYADRLCRRLALRTAVALSARTLAVSTTLAHQLSRDLFVRRSRIGTVPNGVRYLPPERTTLRDELGLRPDDRLVLAVGNLYPVKGHRYLIDALAMLQGCHPRLHLVLIGRGELAATLTDHARQRGLADRVHLLGVRSDIPGILKSADIFVLPSLSEGLPLALLEAMFSGCPIVASDVGEVRVALADGAAGVLVEPRNSEALATALDRLLSDPQGAQTLGQRAARRAAAEYDVSQMVRRYIAAYEAVRETPRGLLAGVLARRVQPGL